MISLLLHDMGIVPHQGPGFILNFQAEWRGDGGNLLLGLLQLPFQPCLCLFHALPVPGEVAVHKGVFHFCVATYHVVLNGTKGGGDFFASFSFAFTSLDFAMV